MISAPFRSGWVVCSALAALLSLATPARADDGPLPRELAAEAAPSLAALRANEVPLPRAMSLKETQDELELKEAHRIDFSSKQPGRAAKSRPFIDFAHFEMGGYVGVVDYSSDFEADPSIVAGITARVPVPGIPFGDWGIFAQGFVSYISRDLPFYYSDKSGSWFGGAVGGDYTFVHDSVWYLRGQAGILYANWNGVNALDDGVGILIGAQVGFYWIRHNQNAVVTLTPQFSYDGSNWIGFVSVGFSYDF